MWYIYISFAVLFRGAYCIPLINTAEHSPCTVVIKRFGEEVKTLEVKWNSTIHLICDVSCVGPRPQFGLTWFYRDKNQRELINIEKLFPSPKFETYPEKFHRKNVLVIRDFGPNEETIFICKGSNKKQRLEAMVALIGTVSPRLTVSPSRLVARAGENIILRCSPIGSGPFNIEWSKANGVLSPRASENEGILEIQQVTAADAGRYRCVVTSASGGSEGYAIVEITVPPTVRAVEREYSVRQNAVVELKCVFTGSPEPTVRWDHESGELPLQHRVQDGALTIYNVQPKDSGRYICTATNAAGTARDYVFVTVSSGPVNNGGETGNDTQILNVGDRVEMECIVAGTPVPKIQWSRDDGPLPASAILGDGILIIPDAKLEDAGTYTCTAINQAGSVQSKVVLYVRARPVISVPQSSMTAALGDSASIGCEASGYPSPQITWHRKNGQMPSEYTIVDGNLKIPRVKTQDAGTYICSAQNQYGQSDASVDLKIGGKSCEFQCRNGTCISSTKKCDGIPDCTDGEDEICDGAWSEWKNISHCYARSCNISCLVVTEPCDKGHMEQIRFCNSPPPGYGGKWCHGQHLRIVECENYVQPGWSEWGPVTCDKDCRSSDNVIVSGYRRRTCNNPPPIHEMDECCGIDIQETEDDSNICKDLPLCISERPTVRVEPYKITVPMRTTGTLRCIVTGVPVPTVTWLKSRQNLSTNHQIDGDILRITQATMEDQGIYVCHAENIAGSDQDWGIVEVERRMRPTIDLYPEGTHTVSVGGTAFFQCRVINGDPPPKVTWSRVGGLQLTERTEVKENGVIMFKGTTQQEQGSYICTATNDMGTTTATATLIVQVEEGQRAEVKIAGPGTLSVVDGGSVELTCTASAILNPRIRWRRREGPLPPGHSLRGGILSIPRLTVEYGGEYICSTSSPEGSYQASVFIMVTVSPRLIVSPYRLVARAGENIILRCSPIGSGPFHIEWSKANGVLSPRASENEGILEIQQVAAADAGRYRCVVTSASGSSEGYAVVEITVPPTIVIQPSKTINAIVGQRVRMECIAQGEPIPSVYWINPLVPRPGNIVPQAGFPQKKGTAILDITNVGKENKGYYTCVAQNAGGRTEDRVQLIVQEGQRAEVKIAGQGTLSVVDGESVELTCTASAILNPRIRWRRREGPLPPGHSLRGGILSIPRLTVEYGGEYICSTSSPEGSYQASVFIIVTVTCRGDQFQCADGNCVEARMKCDRTTQCEDGSDEQNCLVTAAPPAVCTADQYKCASGECVDGRYRCDGQHDCYDGSDEDNCHGAWSEWKNISHCYARACNISCRIVKKPCEKGQMEQIRFCNSPSPGYGGKWCHGQHLRIVECENYVQPGWSEWSPVTCTEDCRSSDNVIVSGYRHRTCNNPPPVHEMDQCCGDEIQNEQDNSTICRDLPLCIYTTVSTTTTSSTTKVTCPTQEGYDYGVSAPNDNASKKDDNDHYDYSSCS